MPSLDGNNTPLDATRHPSRYSPPFSLARVYPVPSSGTHKKIRSNSLLAIYSLVAATRRSSTTVPSCPVTLSPLARLSPSLFLVQAAFCGGMVSLSRLRALYNYTTLQQLGWSLCLVSESLGINAVLSYISIYLSSPSSGLWMSVLMNGDVWFG